VSRATEDAVRAALRERLGAGARYDSPAAPARKLLWARRGTAYFARKLNELRDDELEAPSLLPGWTRRHLVAHVGYNARALARLVEWARTGVEMPMYASTDARKAEIELGSTLPARALRNLFDHAEVHLNVEWRDLTDAGWDAEVSDLDGRSFPVRETAWMRSREVWVHAVDLDNGGSYLDFPPDLLDALIADVLRSWERRSAVPDLMLAATDRPQPIRVGRPAGPVISGTTADLARWLTAGVPGAWPAPAGPCRIFRPGTELSRTLD
jgi:maleylpyruvate isomerase